MPRTYLSEPNLWNRVIRIFKGDSEDGISDRHVCDEIRERLSYHPYVDAGDVDVAVENGDVTLSGVVDDRSSRRLTEDVVKDVRGVKTVHNLLRLRTEATI